MQRMMYYRVTHQWVSALSSSGLWLPAGSFDPKNPIPIVAACGGYRSIQVFRLDTGVTIHSMNTRASSVECMLSCHMRRQPMLALGLNSAVEFVHVAAESGQELPGTCPTVLRGHSGRISSLVALPLGSGDLIATASSDRTIRLWKMPGGTETGCLRGRFGAGPAVSSLCFVPPKKWLVSGSGDSSVRVWDLATQLVLPDGTLYEHESDVNVMMFGGVEHPCIFSGSDDCTIKMFSLDSFKCVRTFETLGVACHSLLLHPTREHLFYSGHYRGVYLWDIRREDRCLKPDETTHKGDVTSIVSVGPGLFCSCANESIVVWTETLKPRKMQKKIATENTNRGLVCLAPFQTSATCCDDLLPEGLGVVDDLQPDLQERLAYFLEWIARDSYEAGRSLVRIAGRGDEIHCPRSIGTDP